MQEVEVKQLGLTRGRNPKPPKTIERVHTCIPLQLLCRLDDLVEKGLFENRSEAIREALQDLISFYDYPIGSKKMKV